MDVPDDARAAHAVAGGCIQERRFTDAIPHAERAVALAPGWGAPWWNLTVAYKHALRWEACLDACDRAIALEPEDAEGPHWNAGIAATALGRWARARQAWRHVGVQVPDGEGPLEMRLGSTPVRVDRDGDAEVVWCDRIDPCRAIIRSVPGEGCARGYGDLVLHDGEPRGRRLLGERSVAVFDELALLRPGGYATWAVTLHCKDAAAVASVMARFEGVDGEIEDWTESLRVLCAACSLGEPDDDAPHEHEHGGGEATGFVTERCFGLALRDEAELARLHRRHWLWKPKVLELRRIR